jgi:hypothetical protein
MTDTNKTDQADSPASGLGRMAALGVAWLAGMGALAFATLPSSSATHTSVATNAAPTGSAESTVSPDASRQTILAAGASTLTKDVPTSNISRLAPEQTVDFIVRFNNDIDELDACSKMFRNDKEAAQKIFTDWASAHDALEGVTLKSVSYSGEMLLTWQTGINRPLSKREVEDKLVEIKSMPSVRYADPDYKVKAQGGR